jgi:hypothetical protein
VDALALKIHSGLPMTDSSMARRALFLLAVIGKKFSDEIEVH